MSSFQTPKAIENYLNLTWRKPPSNFVNASTYYTGLDPFFMNYMTTVVRPCMAYMSGAADGVVNSGLKMNVGYTIRKTAVRLIKGDKIMFEGIDEDSKMLSDYWAPSVGFDRFYEGCIDDLLNGTTIIKLNKDAFGRCVPVSERVDRYYATTDDCGNVIRVTIFNSLLFQMNFGNAVHNSFWLVEERFFKRGAPYVKYKVHVKSGIAGQELLPAMWCDGIPEQDLPEEVTNVLRAKNIKVNKDIKLPFRDGLGVWNATLTAKNSCVPGLAMGDPLLYGALDLLWSVDMVFSGSLTDVILGKSKILVPKRFLENIRRDFASAGIKTATENLSDRIMLRSDMQNDDDDSFVYVATERDKDFPPQSVQFNIRSEEYRGMFELYLRQIVSHCGFAPTSVFPFLQDGSNKTAREVTAEENLTRATVQSIHQTLSPVIDRMLNEVLYQLYKDAGKEYKGNIKIKLSDYVGNKLLRDENIRNNYQAGLIPQDVAVQQVNGISNAETEEYMDKIKEEQQAQQVNFGEFYPEAVNDDNSEQTAEQAGNNAGRGGSANPFNG
nr:MAG TPA: portal protein [Caudoviricetes sp.]